MNDYRKDFKELSREVYWTMPRIIGWFLALALLTSAASLMLTPVNVLTRAANPDKVIANYEFFHDANGSVQARQAQIVSHKKLAIEASVNGDAAEASRLRIELAAIQQSCRDLTAKYNANAAKLNVGLFRGWSLPESLSLSACE